MGPPDQPPQGKGRAAADAMPSALRTFPARAGGSTLSSRDMPIRVSALRHDRRLRQNVFALESSWTSLRAQGPAPIRDRVPLANRKDQRARAVGSRRWPRSGLERKVRRANEPRGPRHRLRGQVQENPPLRPCIADVETNRCQRVRSRSASVGRGRFRAGSSIPRASPTQDEAASSVRELGDAQGRESSASGDQNGIPDSRWGHPTRISSRCLKVPKVEIELSIGPTGAPARVRRRLARHRRFGRRRQRPSPNASGKRASATLPFMLHG